MWSYHRNTFLASTAAFIRTNNHIKSLWFVKKKSKCSKYKIFVRMLRNFLRILLALEPAKLSWTNRIYERRSKFADDVIPGRNLRQSNILIHATTQHVWTLFLEIVTNTNCHFMNLYVDCTLGRDTCQKPFVFMSARNRTLLETLVWLTLSTSYVSNVH